MRVCVVGSGAREHALAAALARDAKVVVTPGNPGIASIPGVEVSDQPPSQLSADLVVIGPEAPLVAGLADELRDAGVPVFGPGADGARLEGSKAHMKAVAAAAGVPTARWASFDRLDEARAFLRSLPGFYVVKTDGLAAGKGVLVTHDLAEAEADCAAKLSGSSFGDAGRRVVIEEGLEGEEISLLALCNGREITVLPPAQDYKRLLDGDAGPNTGGMGAVSPVPVAAPSVIDAAIDTILEPTVAELVRRGVDYRGVLYAGLICGPEGPKLIEFNVRFGDPEAEVVLPRCRGDLAELFATVAAGGALEPCEVSADAGVCVVVAAPGYPGSPESGASISGLERAGTVEGVTVYHAGTTLDAAGGVVVAGGRVLCVSALGESVAAARERAYRAVSAISFEGMQFRHDIAARDVASGASAP